MKLKENQFSLKLMCNKHESCNISYSFKCMFSVYYTGYKLLVHLIFFIRKQAIYLNLGYLDLFHTVWDIPKYK